MSQKEEVVIAQAEEPQPLKPAEEGKPEAKAEGLPENFKSVEDMAKALKETKAELTKLQQGKTSNKVEETLKISVDAARAEVEKAGLDWDGMVKEFEDNGSLSDDTFKTLEKKGIPKERAEQFVQGQVALAEQFANRVKEELAIPADEYNAMLQWAADTLSEEDKISFNNQVSQMKDPSGVKRAIRGLQAEYEATVGKAPRLLTGQAGRLNDGGDTYRSWAQVQVDIQDKRYSSDEAFREDVKNKLARSNL
jgi:hypothetical protein